MLVDLISNSLRYRKIPAIVSLRPNEKLLDALLSLAEIFRLVSYSEHVPYALRILPMGAPLAIRERRACGSIPRFVLSMLALLFDCRQMYQKASCTVYFRSA